jgi:hypothetical protein
MIVALQVTQAPDLRAGRYEMITEMEMPGMKMPPNKKLECITADDLKDFSKFVISDMGSDCKVPEVKLTSGEMTFTANCTGGGKALTMSMKMTFAGTSMTGLMTATEKGKPVMTIRSSGKRVGDCTK